MTHTYQGHLDDGSSVQKHSAGDLYPYVIAAVDDNGRYYILIGPGIDGVIRSPHYAELEEVARRFLTLRENDDAWAFELEALCRYAGQTLSVMHGACRAIAEDGPHRWDEMTPSDRVRSLLRLATVRNAMFLPETMAQRSLLCRAAKCLIRDN